MFSRSIYVTIIKSISSSGIIKIQYHQSYLTINKLQVLKNKHTTEEV